MKASDQEMMFNYTCNWQRTGIQDEKKNAHKSILKRQFIKKKKKNRENQ